MKLKNMTLEERLLRFVVVADDGCWCWIGPKTTAGYGQFRFHNRWCRPHRIAYELWMGEIPKGMFVCHSCDMPDCVNPTHLWVGTASDNQRDSVKKGRNQSNPENLALGSALGRIRKRDFHGRWLPS